MGCCIVQSVVEVTQLVSNCNEEIVLDVYEEDRFEALGWVM